MSVLTPFYPVVTWRDGVVFKTPEQLLKRVLEDSKSDYNWIAPASELVRVCKRPCFPKEIGAEIEDLILRCFTNLAVSGIETPYYYYDDPKDRPAVFTCYCDSKNTKLKNEFLQRTVKRAILFNYGELGRLLCFGPEHDKFEQDFTLGKIYELLVLEERSKYDPEVDFEFRTFDNWRSSLLPDYDRVYKAAKETGRFESDYQARKEMFKVFRGDTVIP